MTAQLMEAMLARHSVALMYLRRPDALPPDSIAGRCERVIEVPHPWSTSYTGRRLRQARLAYRLASGTPLWASRWTVPGFEARLRSVVNEWAPDVIQFETHVMGQYAEGVAGCAAARVLHQHEPGTAAAHTTWKLARGARRLLTAVDCAAWRRYEVRVMQHVDAVVVLTRRDRRFVTRLVPGAHIACIPFGTTIPPLAMNPLGSEPTVLFVGAFEHYPNVDAAERLLHRIFPQVINRYPAARLLLVGSRPPDSLLASGCAGASVVGPVANVTPYLDRAAIVVAPMRLGSGMRLKVIEALAAGKAVVCSRRAAEGLDVCGGVHVHFAESDEEFATELVTLLQDPRGRRDLAERARAWATVNATWNRTIASYEQLYAGLTGPRSQRTARGE